MFKTELSPKFNRQPIHGEVNPLFKKFVNEGENPSTYIPADKRRQIYDYMSKVNFKPFESKQLYKYKKRVRRATLITLYIKHFVY